MLRLHPRLAPVKVAVLPLVSKEGMPERAREIYEELRARIPAEYDEGGSIGKRYRRQDEIGTPWGITVDGETLEDGTVTLRDRDTLEQERVPADGLADRLAAKLAEPWTQPEARLRTLRDRPARRAWRHVAFAATAGVSSQPRGLALGLGEAALLLRRLGGPLDALAHALLRERRRRRAPAVGARSPAVPRSPRTARRASVGAAHRGPGRNAEGGADSSRSSLPRIARSRSPGSPAAACSVSPADSRAFG